MQCATMGCGNLSRQGQPQFQPVDKAFLSTEDLRELRAMILA